jgi:hypothetical protein
MNTIKFLFIMSAVLFTSVLKGQATINPAIKATLDAFIAHSNNQDWDKAFDLLYPKLFTKVSKQELVDLMGSQEAEGMTLKMQNTRITSTSVPITEGSETFVRVEYVADMEADIIPGGKYDYPKSITALDEQFKAIYGGSNVKWNADGKEFQIIVRKAIIAVENGKDNWTIVEVNMDQPALMESLFSPNIMDALVRI